jgi:hypothetical protein
MIPCPSIKESRRRAKNAIGALDRTVQVKGDRESLLEFSGVFKKNDARGAARTRR